MLNNIEEIRKLDTQNMLGSIEALGKQIEQVWELGKNVEIPEEYKKINKVVLNGMGASALGVHIIKSIFKDKLAVPIEIVSDYSLPNYIDENTLVIISSYSGSTEEPIYSIKKAKQKNSKIVVISSGNDLKELYENGTPGLIYEAQYNPCDSPRMGLGYSIFGQLVLFSKLELIDISEEEYLQVLKTVEKYNKLFGVNEIDNEIKQMAEKLKDRSVLFVGAEHLSGNMHVAQNQMNENNKRMAGYHLLPELNHHLLEGMRFPESNKDNLLVIMLNSDLYFDRIQKRFEVTKKVLEKNEIKFVEYNTQESTKLNQAFEVLVLSSYLGYYGALLEGLDPTDIPWVDYFKAELAK